MMELMGPLAMFLRVLEVMFEGLTGIGIMVIAIDQVSQRFSRRAHQKD